MSKNSRREQQKYNMYITELETYIEHYYSDDREDYLVCYTEDDFKDIIELYQKSSHRQRWRLCEVVRDFKYYGSSDDVEPLIKHLGVEVRTVFDR